MVQTHSKGKNRSESILDTMAMKIFGHPLTVTQQVWVGFILPTAFSTMLFVSNFAVDAGVVHQLSRDGHNVLAAVSLLFVYCPAIVCLTCNLCNPPNMGNLHDTIWWFVIQIFHFMFFPIGVMHRFATILFWSVVSLQEEESAQEEALINASGPHQTELFFLMDAFLHAAPQALVQSYILLSPQIITSRETDSTEVASVIISVATLAKAVALFQRFESQRVVGRLAPWTLSNTPSHAKALVNITKLDPAVLIKGATLYKTQETVSASEAKTLNADQSYFSPLQTDVLKDGMDPISTDTESTSKDTSELHTVNILEPTKQLNLGHGDEEHKPTENDPLLSQQEDQLKESISSESNSLSQEDTAHQKQLKLVMRLDSSEGTASVSSTIDPTQRNTTVNQCEQNKSTMKGLTEDEPLGIVTAFFGWWFFLMSRVLAVSSFTFFYPWASIGTTLLLYILIVVYLNFCHPQQKITPFTLGFIFILSPVEINIQYRYPLPFLISFLVITSLQNIIITLIWYLGAHWETLWYSYTCYVIFGGLGMAAINAILYTCFFHPKTKSVTSDTHKSSKNVI